MDDNKESNKASASDDDTDGDNDDNPNDEEDKRQFERPRRQTTPRKLLLPGTHSKHEIEIRKQQYSNLCLDILMENDKAIFILNCMEATLDEETSLLKELELLTACAIGDDDEELLMPTIANEREVNLNTPDPKPQSDIDRMDPKDAMRFNDATLSEVNCMKSKNVFENTTMDDLLPGTKVYQSVECLL